MYWICFGDSALGMLAAARTELDPAMDMTKVISLADDLSVGNISDLRNREARSFGICPWQNDPEFADIAEECVERYYQEALPAFEAVDEAVIWYGNNPAEQCGMLRAAHDLYARGVQFSLVHVDRLKGEELPQPEKPVASAVFFYANHKLLTFTVNKLPQPFLRHIVHRFRQKRWRGQRANMVCFRGVGELEPETAKIFYSRRRTVKDCEAKLLYTRWEQLVQENAPLRVMKDGKPVSAPLEYYDQAIISNTPSKETAAAFVIGHTLGEYAVNDCWVFERIRALAAAGKLEIVKDGANYRDTTVKKRE